MARVALPQSRLRQRRRRRRWLVGGALVLVFLLAFGGIVWLSQAPFMRIIAIEVLDTKTIASTTIENYARQEISGNYAGLFARSNIFLYPRQTIVQGLLEQYPALRAVDVRAKDFHTIVVKVAEREPVALWCDNRCYLMDENGLVYSQSTDSIAVQNYVEYFGSSSTTLPWQYLTAEQFSSLSALTNTIRERISGSSIDGVTVDSYDDVRMHWSGTDFELLFNLKDDGGDVFERLSLALASDVFKGKTFADFEYLDLRFGDKLYYKLR